MAEQDIFVVKTVPMEEEVPEMPGYLVLLNDGGFSLLPDRRIATRFTGEQVRLALKRVRSALALTKFRKVRLVR